MNNLRALILLLVYSLSLTALPLAARTESNEKEVAHATTTVEHRESGSNKIGLPERQTSKPLAGSHRASIYLIQGSRLVSGQIFVSVPIFLLHCVHRL